MLGIGVDVIEWLKGEIKFDKETTIEYIGSIFKNSLPSIIENAK